MKRYIIFNQDGISEAVDTLDGEEYVATYRPRDIGWEKDYQAIDTETGDIYKYEMDEDGAEYQWWFKGNISEFDKPAIEPEPKAPPEQMPISEDGGFLLPPEFRDALWDIHAAPINCRCINIPMTSERKFDVIKALKGWLQAKLERKDEV